MNEGAKALWGCLIILFLALAAWAVVVGTILLFIWAVKA